MRHHSSLIQRFMLVQWARGTEYSAPKPQSSSFWIQDITIQLLVLLFMCLLTRSTDQNWTITERQDARKIANLKRCCLERGPEMEPRWKTYYPAARVPSCIIFDIFFHFSPLCFQHRQNMMLSLPEEIAFCRPPPPHYFGSYYMWCQRGHLDILHRL